MIRQETRFRTVVPDGAVRGAVCFGIVAFLFFAAAIPAAHAQSGDLVRELQRMRRDLSDLQRYVYRGRAGATGTASPSSRTADNREAVSRLQVQVQTLERQMRQLTGRIEEFDHGLRVLSGRLDKLVADIDLRLRGLEDSVSRMRLSSGSGVPPGASAAGGGRGATGAVPSATAVSPVAQTGTPTPGQATAAPVAPGMLALPGGPGGAAARASAAPTPGIGTTTVISSKGAVPVATPQAGLLPGQKSLGTLSASDLKAVESGGRPTPAPGGVPAGLERRVLQTARAASAPPPAPVAAPTPPPVQVARPNAPVAAAPAPAPQPDLLPQGTPKEQYDYAFSLLKKRDVPGAEAALKAFLARHPDHALAGNAMYWLGETYYVRRDYSQAAQVFLDGFQRYPKSNKAPDNLFKLGKSLVAVGEKEPACAAFKKLIESYPRANARILSTARREMGKLGCS